MTDLTSEQLRLYLWEIFHESKIAEDCFRRFEQAAETWLQSHVREHPTGALRLQGELSEREMMAALEGVLSAFARVSLFLFPEARSGAFGITRSRQLKQVLEIDESHPVSNRKARNDWMHLDERIDREVQKGREVPIGYRFQHHHRLSSEAVNSIVRLIDPGAETVYIFGEPHQLREMARAVGHITQQAALVLVND